MKPLLGLRDPLFALSLLAIDPGLKGVVIGGPPGTGKTLVARSARAFWPEGTPFVEIPLGVTLDRLIGTIDFVQSRKQQKIHFEPGLLARADGGIVYVDEINLLPPEIRTVILQALDTETVVVEREGVSTTFPARFVLIGTYNPDEGKLPAAFLDRLAFSVQTRTLRDVETRLYITKYAANRLIIPEDMIESVAFARRILHQVTISEKYLKELCGVATRTGVEGNRAEIFAVRCAKADAALHRRTMVTQGDVDLAIRLIYVPRGGGESLPGSDALEEQLSDAPNSQRDNGEKNPRSQEKQQDDPVKSKQDADAPQPEQHVESAGDVEENERENPSNREHLVRLEKSVPLKMPVMDAVPSGGNRSGKHQGGINFRRGRHVRSIPGNTARARIDILSTLKRAALSSPLSKGKQGGIRVKKDDIMVKQYLRRAGLLIVFAVDASGSMVFNRLGAAKGAAISLLKDAYVYRDQVAVINFCRTHARMLLTPGGGLTKATHALRNMPAGGRTPIPAALAQVLEIANRAPTQYNVSGTVLVLITDGRANQPIAPVKDREEREARAFREMKKLAAQLRSKLVGSIVIDTRKVQLKGSEAWHLAKWLNARYVYLPTLNAHTISAAVKHSLENFRK